MALTFSGSTAAMGMSVVIHVGAIVAAGMHGAPAAQPELTPMEMVVETEPVPEPPEPSQVPDLPEPVNAPPVAVDPPVHHEALAVRAVAATEPKPDLSPPAEAPRAMVSDDALPRFTIATSSNGAGGQNLAKTSGVATTLEGVSSDDAPYAEGAVDVPARPLRPVHPRYPTQAQTSGMEGRVKLEIVLSSGGVVQTVRALSHPGHGFEESALAEARRTPFSPAMKRGRAVPVRMVWTVEFQLQ